MSTDLTALPTSIIAGTTVSYLRTLEDYDPSEWTLTLYLRGIGQADVQASPEAGSFRVIIPANEGLAGGTYRWEERVSKGAEVYSVGSGFVVVAPDLATAGEGDLQSAAEKELILINAAIQGRIPKDQESYQIAGRALSRIPLRDLYTIRAQLQAAVNREKAKTTGRFSRPVKVTFPRVGS